MRLSPDQLVFWHFGIVELNATLVFTWLMMVILTLAAMLVTRRLSSGEQRTSGQNLLEMLVIGMSGQIEEIGLTGGSRYLPFLGTLFIFVAASSLGGAIPGFEPPTGSLSTTAALALCVFVAVPFYGIQARGFAAYLKSYVEPTVLMLPFNIVSEVSRTLALAVRLFGNMMSGVMIVGILVSIIPLLFPVVMTALGLLTGMVQAYIFSVLAAVYIAAATRGSGPDVGTVEGVSDLPARAS